jgi:hypothetical protein
LEFLDVLAFVVGLHSDHAVVVKRLVESRLVLLGFDALEFAGGFGFRLFGTVYDHSLEMTDLADDGVLGDLWEVHDALDVLQVVVKLVDVLFVGVLFVFVIFGFVFVIGCNFEFEIVVFLCLLNEGFHFLLLFLYFSGEFEDLRVLLQFVAVIEVGLKSHGVEVEDHAVVEAHVEVVLL